MLDIRLQRMAQVLVHHSLGLKKGARFSIHAEHGATPLVQEVFREALRVGSYPEVFINLPGTREILLKEGSDEQLAMVSPVRRLINEEYDALLQIVATENTKQLQGVDPSRILITQKSSESLLENQLRRTAEGNYDWCLTLFPTNASAQDANMSLTDFEEFVYNACFLNDENPVARWQELSTEQARRIEWLKGKKSVHILGPETDLTLSIEGRSFLNDDGKHNFPGGEFFTSPVDNSAQGVIRYTFSTSYNGQSVEDIRLRFENGVVVEAQAAQGQDFLQKMLQVDEGASRLGEFAFGNNSNIDRSIKNILFDEKIGGTIHLALGMAFEEVGGKNKSGLHWDMVCDLRQGSEIHVDGELFYKNGSCVI